MKKKVLTTLLCVSMVASMMTGCGKTPATTETVQQSTVEKESKEETTQPSTEEEVVGGLAEAEALPAEAAYHFTFDGSDEGIKTVTQVEDVGTNTGATFGLAESTTYIDKEGAEQPVVVQYANGPVDKCAYIDGNFGLKFPVDALETETYTISYWLNADRLSTFGPTFQIGSDMGMDDTQATVKWINVTQTEWGANNAKIFPVVWNRNSETGAFPWVYAADDAIHGKKEWVMVTIVATGDIYNYVEEGIDRNACQYYINGELAFDAVEGTYGGLATDIMGASDNFEAYFGINYWDSVYKGFVDDLYIYKEALTPGQVASLYLLGDGTVESVADGGSGDDAEPTPPVITTIDSKAIAVVGAPTCDNNFWTSASDGYELKDGGTITMKFNNYSSGFENYHNYVLGFCNTKTTADKIPSPENYEGYAEYGVLRGDAFGWNFLDNQDPVFEFDWEWDDFKTIMMDAEVTLEISRKDDTVTVEGVVTDADGKEYSYKAEGITSATAADDMYVFMTNEKSYIEILSVK